MAAAPRKKPSRDELRGGHPESAPVSALERELGDLTRSDIGPAFAAARRLRALGLMLDRADVPEKEKISITLDKPLVDEIRTHFGGRALSTTINELLYAALAQARLGELVEEMEAETGTASQEAYDRVLAQWFAEE